MTWSGVTSLWSPWRASPGAEEPPGARLPHASFSGGPEAPPVTEVPNEDCGDSSDPAISREGTNRLPDSHQARVPPTSPEAEHQGSLDWRVTRHSPPGTSAAKCPSEGNHETTEPPLTSLPDPGHPVWSDILQRRKSPSLQCIGARMLVVRLQLPRAARCGPAPPLPHGLAPPAGVGRPRPHGALPRPPPAGLHGASAGARARPPPRAALVTRPRPLSQASSGGRSPRLEGTSRRASGRRTKWDLVCAGCSSGHPSAASREVQVHRRPVAVPTAVRGA